MVCSVNGEVVIDLKDLALVKGKVGLANSTWNPPPAFVISVSPNDSPNPRLHRKL